MLFVETFALEYAVDLIQEQYFDRHPILFRDVEIQLQESIQQMLHALAIFDEYKGWLSGLNKERRPGVQNEAGAGPTPTEAPEGHLSLDIETVQMRAKNWLAQGIADEWVKDAKERAVADILQETGEHEAYVWRTFRERVKA